MVVLSVKKLKTLRCLGTVVICLSSVCVILQFYLQFSLNPKKVEQQKKSDNAGAPRVHKIVNCTNSEQKPIDPLLVRFNS